MWELPTSCYPRKRINNIPHCIALRLRRNYDGNEKFIFSAIKYKNYLIARNYKPSILNKHFANISSSSREQPRQKSTNRESQVSKSVKLIMKYNPSLSGLTILLKKPMPFFMQIPPRKLFFCHVILIQYLKEINY